jgi:AbrB family looped-hinge helix DNA binding protein
MSIVQVSPKGQIVIPANLRKKYNIGPRDKVEVIEFNDEIVIVPIDKDPIKTARGFLNLDRSAKEVMTEIKQELKKKKEER